VLTSWLAGLTTRGTSFLAAGVAAAIAGIALSERSLLCVGVALITLPVFSVISARRARYRLSCTRIISPPRIPAGNTALVTLQLHNVSKLPTGLLLAEDSIPYALGPRPRYVLDNIERRGERVLSYPLRSDLRGKFEVGPLQLRVADSFGLVEITRSFSSRTPFVVTPRVYPLARTMMSRSWAGEGDGRSRLAATAGEDDVIPRPYNDGDDLRRVHWRSTARYGDLMVRREEQRWRNRATVLLDTRAGAHMGSGPSSSFETAISAAASVGVHLAQEGLAGQVINEQGTSLGAGMAFQDTLLESLAVITPSRGNDLADGFKVLRGTGAGVIVAIMGRLSQLAAEQLAICRTEGSQAIALLLAVSTWADSGRAIAAGNGSGQPGTGQPGTAQPGTARPATGQPEAGRPERESERPVPGPGTALIEAETARAVETLRAAGWHVIAIDASTPLDLAWEQLPRAAEMLVPGASLAGHDAAGVTA
jgi:uncharacterized protein (DUF58 family)